MFLEAVILVVFVLSALWAVMARSLLRSAIALAATSAFLSVLMYKMGAYSAAVVELSVCSGLISVVFISAISLTQPLTRQEVLEHMKYRLARFWMLPVIVLILGVFFGLSDIKPDFKFAVKQEKSDVREILWNNRQVDLLGQIIVLLTGGFGVIILFRERGKK